jgi:hypothetical protein
VRDEQAITVTRDSWGMWRAKIPADETAKRGTGWLENPGLPVLLAHAHVIGQAEGLRVELWDDSTPPGGWVCGWPVPDGPDGACGVSVEDEPCDVHWPPAGEPGRGPLDALLGDAAATGRHPLGRHRAGRGCALLVAAMVLGTLLVGAFLAWRHR